VIVNGVAATLLTYEGSFVAPTIRARRGDRVLLRFRNGLPQTGETNLLGHPKYPTNVHVHGLHVTPGANPDGLPGDDVHLTVMPDEELTYEYLLDAQRPGSLALYHPHVHGSVAEQMWSGLVGAIDVADYPITTLTNAYDPARTRLLVLKDLTIANGAPTPYTSMMEYMHGKEGDWCLVNGQLNPSLAVGPGEVTRFRIINASNARFYRLALQGHSMWVVGTDGGLLDRAYQVSELLLSPGERADVLVRAGAKGTYKLLALPYARQGMMASSQTTLLTYAVQNSAVADRDPATLGTGTGTIDPEATRLVDDAMLPRAQFRLSMGQGRGYVNGISFEVVGGVIHAFEHMSTVGTDEIWTIVNDSGMDHPWHQHVNDGQVLATSGGDATYAAYARILTQAPAWKDTIIVPKFGSVTFRLPIRDFSGMTMFHCHILEHEDIGMMGMWHLMDGGMPM
jgi:FtsP/CotA-like multicopper oxidase with cupredoxin domain